MRNDNWEKKKCPNHSTRTYCKHSRPTTIIQISRTPQHWMLTKHHCTTPNCKRCPIAYSISLSSTNGHDVTRIMLNGCKSQIIHPYILELHCLLKYLICIARTNTASHFHELLNKYLCRACLALMKKVMDGFVNQNLLNKQCILSSVDIFDTRKGNLMDGY